MSVWWQVKVLPLVVWVFIWGISSPVLSHSLHNDPYLDPELYENRHVEVVDEDGLYQGYDDLELSDDLAVQVKGDVRQAIELAHKYGLHFLNQVFENPPVYHLHQPRPTGARPRRHAEEISALVKAIAQEPGVEWVNQQVAFSRVKRGAPKYNIYSNEDESQEDREQGREEGIYHNYHEIPSGVKKSERALSKTLHRQSYLSNHGGMQVREQKDLQNIFHFSRSREYEDGLSDEYEASDEMHSSERGQNKNMNSADASQGLSRIPLSRNVGYEVDHARAKLQDRFPKDNQPTDVNGRIYIPRYRQLKNNIKMLSKHNKNVKEYENRTTIDTKNSATGDDLEAWIDHLFETVMNFNDPLYNDQWYLRNTGQLGRAGYDLNVTWAWLKGYTGRGIVLSVLDDGIQITNADIAKNYLSHISYSLIRDGGPKNDPSPRLDPEFTNSHGTYCAAIMAAVHNNSVCGVGVAYHAQIGGVRIVDGKVTDIQEATALSRFIDKVDVFSASWGPTDDGTKVEGPGKLTKLAFLEGVTKGRKGKGVVYVWASGNGGLAGDNCNLDGYTSSIYTLSVSALTDAGTSTFYEEPCASVVAAVYVGGDHTLEAAKENKKKHVKELRVVVPELDGHCSETFQGTSAAAPLMAGIVALVLEANGNLTWRDVQHIVVETSSPTPQALMEPGWHTNGKGKRFHLMQGYGAVNAGKMVETALQWKNVKPQKVIILPMFNGYRDCKPYTWSNISRVLDTSAVPSSEVMSSVEHVVANITISHPQRRLLTIFIVSPSGTTSQVLTHRSPDKSTNGFTNWGFMSVHFWGENPQGSWTVAVMNDSGKKGFLKKIELMIYGS